MWWPKPLLAALALLALGLAGCGLQPLYGSTASGSRLAAVMSGVEVAPVPGRVGQRVRNELIFENTGGGGAAPQSTYKLDIVIKENITNELVQITGDAKSQVYELDATFKLIARDGRVVLEGKATSRAAYERFQTIFSNVRARRRRREPRGAHCRREHQDPHRRLSVAGGLSSSLRNGRSFPWSLTRPDRFSASSNRSTPPAAPGSSTARTQGSWPSALLRSPMSLPVSARTRWRSSASTREISRKIRRDSRSSFAPSPCSPMARWCASPPVRDSTFPR